MASDGSPPASLSPQADFMVPPQDHPPPHSMGEGVPHESLGFRWGLPGGAQGGVGEASEDAWESRPGLIPTSAPYWLCGLRKF